jgi:glucokinase
VINDMEANAWGLAALGRDDLVALHDVPGDPDGNVALVSAGTGLGAGFATSGESGPRAHASEGGHTDFAPRTELEAELRDWLAREGEHVSYERVCSGMGLLNTYEFLRTRSSQAEPEWLMKERAAQGAAAITRAGLERRDAVAGDALGLMVSVYGAQAGNVALTVMATGGVYLGGGIAPKILPRLLDGEFMRAFTDKGRLSDVLERIPVWVILNELTALLGAARHAEATRSGPAPSA